jgi:hypothetical protein
MQVHIVNPAEIIQRNRRFIWKRGENMKIILILFVLSMLLLGCSQENSVFESGKDRFPNHGLRIGTDLKTGCKYIFSQGISPLYGIDGEVEGCYGKQK